MHMGAWLGAALALVLLAPPAMAQQAPPGNAARGKHLAEAMCATCHVLETSRGAGWTDAPAFPAIAARPAVTRAWLREFFTRPHLNMMYTDRPPAEAADIGAYLLSLKPR